MLTCAAVLPFVVTSMPQDCFVEEHADYEGPALTWGLTFKLPSAAQCCQACKDVSGAARRCADGAAWRIKMGAGPSWLGLRLRAAPGCWAPALCCQRGEIDRASSAGACDCQPPAVPALCRSGGSQGRMACTAMYG
jgi:hypothetical protein